VNDTQCSISSTDVNGACTWLYGSNNEVATNGFCIAKSNGTTTCENVNRTAQCGNGAGITSLIGTCGLYDNTCKTLCSNSSETACKGNSRSDDCFWLEKNGTVYSGECVNKV
jgi:hypothetical protein